MSGSSSVARPWPVAWATWALWVGGSCAADGGVADRDPGDMVINQLERHPNGLDRGWCGYKMGRSRTTAAVRDLGGTSALLEFLVREERVQEHTDEGEDVDDEREDEGEQQQHEDAAEHHSDDAGSTTLVDSAQEDVAGCQVGAGGEHREEQCESNEQLLQVHDRLEGARLGVGRDVVTHDVTLLSGIPRMESCKYINTKL